MIKIFKDVFENFLSLFYDEECSLQFHEILSKFAIILDKYDEFPYDRNMLERSLNICKALGEK